jgi:anti-sigma B factor antagonist
MAELLVDARDEGAVRVISPRGFVNAHTAPEFEGALRRALGEGRVRIVVDCSALAYIASAGLGAMMGTIEEIREAGGDLRVAELNDTVRNIFEILGLHHLYRVFPTAIEAVGSYAGGDAS